MSEEKVVRFDVAPGREWIEVGEIEVDKLVDKPREPENKRADMRDHVAPFILNPDLK